MPYKVVKLKNGPMGPGKKYAKKKTNAVKNSRFPMVRRFRPIGPRAGVGNSLYTTFIYTGKGVINPPTLGAPAFYQFNLNGLHDPDRTGAGTQPLLYDEMSVIFERYTVYEVEYKVVMQNTSTTTDCICWVGTSDSADTTTDGDRWIQQGQNEWQIIGSRGTKNDQGTFIGTVNMPQAQGVTRAAYFADDLYSSLFGANPNELYILNLCAMDAQISDPGAINFYIELRMKTWLHGNKLSPAS